MKHEVVYTVTLTYSKEIEANDEYEANDILWKEMDLLGNTEFYEKCEVVNTETACREIA